MICDNWKDANTYPALAFPAAWGSESPVQCLAAWKTANAARASAFGVTRRLEAELAAEEEIEIQELDVVTTTTAEPTADTWSDEERERQEKFLASNRVLQDNTTNTTAASTAVPTAAPTPAPTACPVEEMTTYNVIVKVVVP